MTGNGEASRSLGGAHHGLSSATERDPSARAAPMVRFARDRQAILERLIGRYDNSVNFPPDRLYKETNEHGSGLVHRSQYLNGITTWHRAYLDGQSSVLTFSKEVWMPSEMDNTLEKKVVTAQLNPIGGTKSGSIVDIPRSDADPVNRQPLNESGIIEVTNHVLADFTAALDLREQILTQRSNDPVAARVAEVLAYGRLTAPR